MNKEIVKNCTRNYLPILTNIRKEAAAVLLDEQNPYTLFEDIVSHDPCISINLYRSIGEKRPDKETEHITLSTLANIYGVNALRTKLAQFSELVKTSLTPKDKDYCMNLIFRSMQLSNQVLALSNLMGDQYPKKMAMAALLFSSGELQYAAAKIDKKNYQLSLKERISLNHQVAIQFNLPMLVKQSTGVSFSGSYQSEILYWSYRYLVALEEFDQSSMMQAQEKIAGVLCINEDNTHKHLTQIALDFARENSNYTIFSSARYMLYQHYENNFRESIKAKKINIENEVKILAQVADKKASLNKNTWPYETFINWLVAFQKNCTTETKQQAIRHICGEIDKTKPTDMFLFLRYCRETKVTKVVWSSCKNQINLQQILQSVKSRDALVDVIVRKDRSINISPESVTDHNLSLLFKGSFLSKLGAKQLILSPVYEDYFESSGGHFVYLFCAANIYSELNKSQVNIVRMIRHFFRKHYVTALKSGSAGHNVVQITRN